MYLPPAVAMGLLGAMMCLAGLAQENVTVSRAANPKPKGPVGMVAGTVYCADTNAPARLAQVSLVPATGEDAGGGFKQRNIVDLDGHFAIGRVPEGKYYVSAILAGYLNPLGSLDQKKLASLSPEARKAAEAHLISVVVSAKQPAQLSIRLERAAEIDGTVLYDDGSPAIGLHVDMKPKSAAQDTPEAIPQVAPFVDYYYSDPSMQSTDDHGRYRIVGVSPGEYLVSVTVPTSSGEEVDNHPFVSMMQTASIGALTVYYGDVFRGSKAKPIKIESAGSTAGADITIPLSKLHTIRGYIILKSTGEPPPAGAVMLQYADNHENARMGLVNESGEFSLFYVPEDNYVLTAGASPEPLPHLGEEDDSDTFLISGFRVESNQGTAAIPLLVAADMSGVTVAVPDPPAKPNASQSTEPTVVPEPQ